MSDSRARGWGFETYLRCVVFLSKTLFSPKVLVVPRKRWLRPNITEKLLTGTLSRNTNKQTNNKTQRTKTCRHMDPDQTVPNEIPQLFVSELVFQAKIFGLKSKK